MALKSLDADDVAGIASGLHLTDFVTGEQIPWRVSSVQHGIWRAVREHQRVFIAKPRRVYASTACDLDDALWTALQDADGQRVRCGVALDTEDHTRERVWQMDSFLSQLAIPHRATDGLIEFPGGSQIVVFTAGGKRAGASTGYQRMRYSEAAYYKAGQIATISAAVGQEGTEVIETTIGAHAENFVEVRARWRESSAWKPYRQHFISFMEHPEYRGPAELITEEEWAWLKSSEMGFPDTPEGRRAAVWWFKEILPSKMAGDIQRAKGEYPQIETHMFAVSAGLWVHKTPRKLEPLRVIIFRGEGGDDIKIFVWHEPAGTTEDIVIGVDTATGKGKDRSVVLAVDRGTRRLLASTISNTVFGDDVASAAHRMWSMYSYPRADGPMQRPKVRIEDNTTGQITIQPAKRLGLPFTSFNTSDDTRYLGLLAAKLAVEREILEGPEELLEECDELSRDEHGAWKGRKDVLMTYGFCALDIDKDPPTAAPKQIIKPERKIDGKAIIARQIALQRMRGGL